MLATMTIVLMMMNCYVSYNDDSVNDDDDDDD